MTEVVTWPDRFITHFTVDQILRIEYLTGTPNSEGLFVCKACGGPVSGAREAHYKKHVKEVKAWDEKRKAEAREKKLEAFGVKATTKPKAPKSEFYTNPCRECGNQIPRSGKRGKPPVKCATCRGEVK